MLREQPKAPHSSIPTELAWCFVQSRIHKSAPTEALESSLHWIVSSSCCRLQKTAAPTFETSQVDVERQVATTARLFLCRWCILCRYIKCVCMCEAANTGLLVALAGSAGLKPCKQKTWWMKRPNSLTDEVEAHDPCYDARHAGKY